MSHPNYPDDGLPIVAPSGETPESSESILDFYTPEQAQAVLDDFLKEVPVEIRQLADLLFMQSNSKPLTDADHPLKHRMIMAARTAHRLMDERGEHCFLPIAYAMIRHNPYGITDPRFFAVMLVSQGGGTFQEWVLAILLENLVRPAIDRLVEERS